MLLEIEAQVKQWCGENLSVVQNEGDQQAADAPVAVEKGMDRLKLRMGQGRLLFAHGGNGLED